MPALVAAGYQVIAPDQRGFGASDAPRGVKQYRMATIVSDAVAVLLGCVSQMAELPSGNGALDRRSLPSRAFHCRDELVPRQPSGALYR